MPQLQFPIPSGELTLTVVVGPNRNALAAVMASGMALPPLVWTTGVVDTGTNITCVTPAVLRKLGLTSTGQGSSHTAGGLAAVNLFEVSLSIPPPANVPGPMLTRSDLPVMEMPSPIPGVEVLIGLDILLDCKMLLDGPARWLTLDF
ncbi:MAG TPA: aspartyl protease family protein [Gemmataceae bacterium]|nr:aspartyl protease family protein [Gemmataceae bacterium]